MSKIFVAVIFFLSLFPFHTVSSLADDTARIITNKNAATEEEPECVDVYPSYPLSPMYQDVTITAVGTHFDNSTVVEFSCDSIIVFGVKTVSPTQVTVVIGVSNASYGKKCDVTVHTGEETLVCTEAFQLCSPPQCDEIQFDPESFMYCAGQPATLDVHLTSDVVCFDNETEIEFLCPYEVDLELNDVTLLNEKEMTANITVFNSIRGGGCDISIKTADSTITCGNGFRITYPGPGRPLESISPESIDTGLGILPRFAFVTVYGNELCDNINFTHESTIALLPDTGGIYVLFFYAVNPKEIMMFIMIWGADKESYDIHIDGHTGAAIDIY